MKDIYNINTVQKQKKKTTEQEQADEQLIREAEKIEQKNYQKSKQARMKLEQAALRQKSTTATMKQQGEKISKAKRDAISVHKNAKKAEGLAEDLENHSKTVGWNLPLVGSIGKWFSKDRKEEEEIQKMENKEEMSLEENENEISDVSDVEGEEMIKGQNKTDTELKKILKTMKGINTEAETQSKMAKYQKTDLKDIKKANEYAGRSIEKTDKQLKKNL